MVTKNEIFDYISRNLDCYCTRYYEVVPKQMPCVYVRFSWSPIRRNITLDMTDEQTRAYVYIEVFGQGIGDLVSEVEGIMKDIYFVEELAEDVQNFDPSYERVSMRFMRTLTGGNTLQEN